MHGELEHTRNRMVVIAVVAATQPHVPSRGPAGRQTIMQPRGQRGETQQRRRRRVGHRGQRGHGGGGTYCSSPSCGHAGAP